MWDAGAVFFFCSWWFFFAVLGADASPKVTKKRRKNTQRDLFFITVTTFHRAEIFFFFFFKFGDTFLFSRVNSVSFIDGGWGCAGVCGREGGREGGGGGSAHCWAPHSVAMVSPMKGGNTSRIKLYVCALESRWKEGSLSPGPAKQQRGWRAPGPAGNALQ